MANFNKVILMGNLTRDVELKSIGSGQTVGKIGLAVNRNFTTASGEKRTETTFVDCDGGRRDRVGVDGRVGRLLWGLLAPQDRA